MLSVDMATSTVSLTVRLEARLHETGQVWVAACPALDVVTQAESRPAAADGLREAVEAWFESCIERGTLEAALREVGFSPIGRSDAMPATNGAGDFIEVSIPAYAAAALEGSPVAAG